MREKIARLLCEHGGYEWDELTEKGDLLSSKERFRLDALCVMGVIAEEIEKVGNPYPGIANTLGIGFERCRQNVLALLEADNG